MSSTDRSQTERIRRIRAQLQAVRRAECAACPELGPQGPTDQSTWLSRRFGQAPYRREAANGDIQTQSCCDTVSCDVSTIRFDQGNAAFGTDYDVINSFGDGFMEASGPVSIFSGPIIYINTNSTINNATYSNHWHINNSSQTITVSVQFDQNGPYITFSLDPCGAF
jgi:hypothetical protein